jgi:negative regulator of flagellin synthesis FlgM
MANKIHGYGQPQLPATRGSHGATADVARTDGKPVEPVAPARDAVSLTDTALLMRKLEEAVSKSSGVDSVHVARVREAIARNEYVVDAQRVADKMIKHERELAGKK